jgi:hypothetical protein
MKLEVLVNGKGKAWFGMSRGKWFHAWIRLPFYDEKV